MCVHILLETWLILGVICTVLARQEFPCKFTFFLMHRSICCLSWKLSLLYSLIWGSTTISNISPKPASPFKFWGIYRLCIFVRFFFLQRCTLYNRLLWEYCFKVFLPLIIVVRNVRNSALTYCTPDGLLFSPLVLLYLKNMGLAA